MVSICPYFHVHQPFRMRDYSVFDIGKKHDYFDCKKNKEILKKVANNCYLPANRIFLNLLKEVPEFKMSFSFSGVVLDQFEEFAPDVLNSFCELVDTKKVEIIGETYHHSLSSLFLEGEFRDQVLLHKKKIQSIFGFKTKVFRNTELIFSNEVAKSVENLGFSAVLAEGWDPILGWRNSNFLYKPKGSDIKLLLKNYRLSDDIAFRFSDREWKEYPLDVNRYVNWVDSINGNGEIVNLFMDYETFGEHQPASSGIFEFTKKVPKLILNNKQNDFVTPSDAILKFDVRDELNFDRVVSWADTERDVSAWVGNSMQKSALSKLYALYEDIERIGDLQLMDDFRKLQISDHFYYMCIKYFNDGDVHKYFNPYDSPYDSYINFMNILNDLKLRIDQHKIKLRINKR